MPAPTLSFPLSDFQAKLFDLLEGVSRPALYFARNAVWHLNRANKIQALDPEMAALRSITAGEESASALFFSLKARRYEGAERLRPRSHLHKNALIPFFDAVSAALAPCIASSPFSEPTLLFDESSSPPQLRLRLTLTLPDGSTVFVLPEPPLHLSIQINDEHPDFRIDLEAIASRFNHKSVQAFLGARAEQRNSLLYAGNDGPRRFSGDLDRVLSTYRQTVFRHLTLLCLIDLNPDRQNFVQQCLTAFLKHVGT